MTYRKLHLFIDISGIRNYYDILERTVGVFNQFVEGLQDFDIQFINFNHYPGGNNTTLRLTIRYEFSSDIADMSAIAIAQDLEEKNTIIRWEINEETIETHIKAAHKFASMCISVLVSHNEFRVEYGQRINSFIYYFLKSILEKIGYQFPMIWDGMRKYVADEGLRLQVDSWIDECLIFAPRDLDTLKKIDFLERFIHLLLNCLLIQGENQKNEKEIWRIINISNTLDKICNSYQVNS